MKHTPIAPPTFSRSSERGFSLVLALFIVALILIASLALLANAQYGSQDARSMEQKNAVFDAAEAGVEDAINALDGSSTATSGSSTLADGYAFSYTITSNPGPGTITPSDGINPVLVPPG